MKGVCNAAAANNRGAGKSLNLVLWFAFSLFALLALAVFVLVQNLVVSREYRERAVDILKEAGAEMTTVAEDAANATGGAEKRLYSIAKSYGVNYVIIDENGESVFQTLNDQKYPALAQTLKKELQEKADSVFSFDSELAYAREVAVGGTRCFLCVSIPFVAVGELDGDLGVASLAIALFAIVLAFVASGFVAMLITKPVTEVTEFAKEIARGNYDLNFRTDYFCSEMNELSESLSYACDEISKADRMQKELIANVSHDLKTPLTMIKAYASMIREISGNDEAKRNAHAQIIIDESDRLAALVGDLLDLSRVRAGLEGDFAVFNLSEEVYKITERFRYLSEAQGYAIETEVQDGLYTLAVRARIEQVLYNLIGNAVNYTGEDKKVTVRLFKKGENARFEVVDTGVGIPPEELKTIWDRYYRSSETHKRPVKGTGLGLSIVKGILSAHGCPFGVESESGKGSCFWAEFPPPPDEREESPPEKPNRKEGKKSSREKRREKREGK